MTIGKNTTSNSNTSRRNRLVAIDPGMNNIGLATFEGGRLSDYTVKVIPSGSSIRSRLNLLDKVISQYFEEKNPNIIALEKSTFSAATQNSLLVLAYYRILGIARRRRVSIYEYVPISIRKFVCGNGHATKRDVVKVLISRYPELRVFTGTDRKWKERHNSNLFDAVAVGLTHLKKSKYAASRRDQ